MKSQRLMRQLAIGLLLGIGFGVGSASFDPMALAQGVPSFPDNGYVQRTSGGDGSNGSPAPAHADRSGVSRATDKNYGFRSVGEVSPSLHSDSRQPSEQTPAVISSSFHKATVSTASNTRNLLVDPSSQLAPRQQSLQTQPISASNPTSRDSNQQLTPLSPPSPSSSEVKTQSGSSLQMLLSIGSSLMMVIGLFLGSVWLYRKSIGSSKAGGLPKNVVQILGRTPVATRQQLVLLRFGPKLVLLSMVQGETRAISEISDPLEVDRLAGLCEGSQPGSVSSSFREILTQGVRS